MDGGFRSGDVAAHLLVGYYVETGWSIQGWPVLQVVSAAAGQRQRPVWLIRRRSTNPATGASSFSWSVEQGTDDPNSDTNVQWLVSDPSPTADTLCGGGASGLSWTASSKRAHAVEVVCEGTAPGAAPGSIHRALRPPAPRTASAGAWTALSNGHGMPLIGLGTGAFAHDHEERAIRGALDEGYVLLDSASECMCAMQCGPRDDDPPFACSPGSLTPAAVQRWHWRWHRSVDTPAGPPHRRIACTRPPCQAAPPSSP